MVQGFFEGFDAQARRRHYVTSVVVIVVAVAYCAFFSPSFMMGRQWIPSPSVTFNIAFFPVLILAGLFGYVQSMIFCFLLLACFLVQDISTAYYAIQYVLVAGVAYQAAKALWLIDWKTVLLTSVITAILIGNGEYLLVCLSFPQGLQYYSLVGQGALMLSALPECLLVFYGLYAFYRFAPDRIKKQFYCGFFYTWEYQRYVLTRQKHHGFQSFGSHVSLGLYIDLTMMIVLSIVLTYSLMANYFIQDIPEEAFTIRDEGGDYIVSDLHFLMLVEDESQVVRWKPSNPYEITFNNQTYGYFMVLFLTELGLVLLSAMVPIIILSNYVAQKLAVDPIRQLSEFIDGYVNTPEEERSRYIKMSPQKEPFFHDEIYDAYVALRVLVKDVEDYVAKIQDAQDLENNLKVAQAANEAKSKFLSNISHEIRTPLNAVLGMDEMILRESHEPNTIEYAKFIQNAGKTLLSLINDVLDFSKIEAGMMEIIPVQYDLTSTLNDLYNMISFRAKEKNLKLIFEFDEQMPHLLIGDEIRIKQCVLNILNNAVKYSEEGTVSLNIKYEQISTDDVFIDVYVRDTGIGIKKEDMDKLFAPFQRIDEQNNLTIEGTGLGMSIVRNLLHAMGSELHVESEYGRGSVFYFRLLQRVASWEPIGDFSKIYREMNENEEKIYETFHAPEAKVLVVDDTQMNLSVVRGLLKPSQVHVDTAISGEDALGMFANETYDLILIDYRMPKMDGVELLHHIRELEGNVNQQVPCIVLTANAISGARDEYLAAGFDDYLAKPINGQLLEQMVARYLPQEKVLYEGMEGFVVVDANEDSEILAIENKIRLALRDTNMFNVDKALEYCEEADILLDALEEFYLAISSKADDIERFAKEKDYRNYTILVHALKSSARLVGAAELSAYAAVLEECGDNEREDKIAQLTPELLRQYRAMESILATLFLREEDDLPEISQEELEEAWGDLKELLEVYDYTNADRIMQMLKGYRIPADAKAKFERVRELMAAVDRDRLLELL